LINIQGLNTLVRDFSNHEFQSFVIFPNINIIKQGKFLVVKMSTAKKLFYYQYPYILPRIFLRYKNKYDLQVKIELLKSFCSLSIKKQIHVEKFIKQFSIPNQRIKEIKILLFKALKDLDEFIKSTFKIIKINGSVFTPN
jgi:hypothetical protein